MTIEIKKEGRRFYIEGDTYPVRHTIKAEGARWDGASKRWWTGKEETANAIVAAVASLAPAPKTPRAVDGYRAAPGETFVALHGNTYPIKDALRGIGSRWDATNRVWMVPASQLEAATAMLATVPERRQAAAQPTRSYYGRGRYAGGSYCWGICPVGGFKCSPQNGPCHDCA